MTNSDNNAQDKKRRAEYAEAFPKFLATLTPEERRSLEGTASPDFASCSTFSLPVRADDPAYMSDPNDPIFETLEELKEIDGALPKIALWVHDQIGGLEVVTAQEQFRIALARICEAKTPRLEAHYVALAIGMNLLGNANGYAIAEHFSVKAQTFHEGLGETCKALGVKKPLAKLNTERYGATQYRHPGKAKS